jgi:hypothetical protein
MTSVGPCRRNQSRSCSACKSARAHLVVAALVERSGAAAVPAPRVQQAEAFAWKLGAYEGGELLHLVPVCNALQQSAA